MVMINVSGANSETLSRVNYGVLFQSKGRVSAVYDYWAHTFEIEFPYFNVNVTNPDLITWTSLNYSNKCLNLSRQATRSCLFVHHALLDVTKLRANHRRRLQLALQLAQEVMPSHQHSDEQSVRSRSKRAPLGFIGSISHFLFGTATEKEVKRISAHIQALEERNVQIGNSMASFAEDLSSFMTVSNEKLGNLQLGIEDNHDAIMSIAKGMKEVSSSLHHNLRFSVLMTKQLYLAMSLQEGLQEFLHGVHGLLHHTLSPYLLPYSDITNAINSIQRRLSRASSQLQVKPMSAKEIYSMTNFLWTFKKDSIFITLKFPLVSSVSDLKLYQVYSLPVPFNESSEHTTQLLNLPEYIAFTRDSNYYAFPTKDMWHKGIINAQEHDLPMYPVSKQSCVTSLFFDDKKFIMESCNFRVQLNTMQPNVQHLNTGQYLMSNVSHYFLRCPSGVTQKRGCNFCVLAVPCLCDISTDLAYFPPRLNECVDNSSQPTSSHPVNLAVLMHFFAENQLDHIDGDTTFDRWPSVSTPDMKIFQHKFADFITADRSTDLSLKKVAEAVRNDKVIFQTLAEPILHKLPAISEDDSMSLMSILTVSDTAVTVVLCVVVAYICVRLHLLINMVIAMKSLPMAKSQRFVNIFQTTTTTMAPPVVVVREQNDTILYAILALSLLTLAAIIYRYLTRISRKAHISLEITNGKRCAMIPVVNLPYCPKFFHVQTSSNISGIQVQGWLKPTLKYNNDGFSITNLVDNSNLPMPNVVQVNPLTSLKLRLILKDKPFVYLVAMHGSHAFHMRICSNQCDQCVISVNSVESPAQTTEIEP